MSNGIAVVGSRDSVEYFRILGCDVHETLGGELAEGGFEDLLRGGYRIVFVTEEVFGNYREIIRERQERAFPVITVIPDLRGASWKDGSPVPGTAAFSELRNAVIRAVGQDISGIGSGRADSEDGEN